MFLTILLLFGGTVDPVVLISSPYHLKLVEKHFKLPGIRNKRVDIWLTITSPILDQICTQLNDFIKKLHSKRFVKN